MDGWALAVIALVLMALSVFAHGISAWPGANRYADWYAAHAEDHLAMPEEHPRHRTTHPCPGPPRRPLTAPGDEPPSPAAGSC